jgi:hypothetical protein
MSTVELRRRIKQNVDALPEDQLRSVADFLALVRSGSEPKRLAADRRMKRLRARIRQADAAEISARLIPLEKLRRKS